MKKYVMNGLVLLTMFFPFCVSAITLGEYEAKLKKYQDDAAANKAAMNKTENEISATNTKIDNIKKEMTSLGNEIGALNEEIEEYKVEIKNKLFQSKQLLEYMQLSEGDNLYLEYIFNAETTTDLIYRTAIVQQLTEYNKKTIAELEQMVEDNKLRQQEIENRERKLSSKEDELGDQLVQLGEEKMGLADTAVTVNQQIKIYQELVNSYKKLGCKSSDVIGVDCAVQGEAGIFRRPTTTGYITSEFGSRWGSMHRGVDIASSKKKKEKIYPVANGTIIAKYTDYYGALVIAVEHYSSVKGKWYTSIYAHLSSYAPNLYVGKYVTSNQYLGYMGNTGYVIPAPTASNPNAGTHLHFEIVPCRLYNWSDKNCSTWSKYTAYVSKIYNNKSFKGPRAVITFPSGSRSWSTR